MDLLAYPVRFADGRARVVDSLADAGITQQIALLCKVRRGERVLVPAFGVPDPTFRAGVDLVEINAGLALFGPDVQVEINRLEADATGQLVELTWVGADAAQASEPVPA